MDDYFAILEVPENVTDDELKKKYKKLAMKYHPDRNKEPGAEEKFKKISAAYDVLSDPQKKQEYLNQRMGNPFGGFNVNPGAGQTFHFNFGMGNPFGAGHPFAQFFDLGGNPHNMRPQQRNIEIVHQIHLEDVLTGKETELIYSVPGIQGSQTVKVNIPKGIEHGMKMRFAGAYQQPGFLPSDLYVNIHVLPHSRFNREQANLIATASISVFDAILGSENTITGIDGSTINLVIPAGSQNGQKIKLKGHGLPHFNNNNLRGDLYVILDVKIPTNLSESQRKYLEEFQNIK